MADFIPSTSDDREIFERRYGHPGHWFVVDTASDADSILGKFDGAELRFRITYSGPLKAGAKKPRAEEKDAIRRYLSPQLAELRLTHPVFRGYGLVFTPPENFGRGFALIGGAVMPMGDMSKPRPVDIASGQPSVADLLNLPIDVDGRKYVPLVRSSLALTCGLDILFLRKGGEGALVAEGGDLDNRIKTLFDGLRMPKEKEVPAQLSGSDDIEPIYCLLEDDALITDFSVPYRSVIDASWRE